MTLYRQLLIFTLVLFFLLFSGTWFVKLHSTRNFLINQLESHAQDTATSLGLSISPHMGMNDLPTVETMINAVFDRGYYQVIRLLDLEDNILVDRMLDIDVEGVPHWFVSFVPLQIPAAKANVMGGWQQIGVLYIESHPGFAYQTLWETAVSTSIWFFFAGIVTLLYGIVGLKLLLRPLERVEHQADALCKRKYEIQENIPKSKELRRVVEAMNRMTNKVRAMFSEQAEVAERLRQIAYRDDLTGLGNRRFLIGQMATRLELKEHTLKGSFLIAQVHDLQQLNQHKGFQAGDELIKAVSELIENVTQPFSDKSLSRLTGGDFGIFLPSSTNEEANLVAKGITDGFARLASKELALSDNVGHVAGVTYDYATTPSQLLSKADDVLREAQQIGPNKWAVQLVTKKDDYVPQGQQKWKDTLIKVLEDKKIILYGQPVAIADDLGTMLHVEVFSRIIQTSGEMLCAAAFMPLAERLGIVSKLDKIVLEKIMLVDGSNQFEAECFGVNISPASLLDPSFWEYTLTSLRDRPKGAPKLYFEFAEFSAVQHLKLVKEFATELRKYGHDIGLDHFGQSFTNFGYLKTLRPGYVKIDRTYTVDLQVADIDSHFFIHTLISVAHSLDIKVIAEGVENSDQWQAMKELHLDAIQGYFVDRPFPIKIDQDDT